MEIVRENRFTNLVVIVIIHLLVSVSSVYREKSGKEEYTTVKQKIVDIRGRKR